MSGPEFERTDPDAVFELLSNDLRVAILRALWDAEARTATFSDLREAVGTADSGRFNYHLDRLVGQFVRRTPAGYTLTRAGIRINGAIEAGTYTVAASIEPITLAEPCSVCGGVRTLRYEDETVRVDCESCPATSEFGVPPAVFAGCDRSSIPRVASRYLRQTFSRLDSGFCPFCDGRAEPAVDRASELSGVEVPAEFQNHARTFPLVQYHCRQCRASPTCGLRVVLLDHPAVAGFHYERGIDVRERSLWEFELFAPQHERIRDDDPFRASATFPVEGDALTVVVDGELNTVDVE